MGIKPLVVDATDYADHQYGRSDAFQCRAMEVVESLGLPMEQLLHMGRKLYSRSFWEISGGKTRRTVFAPMYPTFLDFKHDYALCLRQGMIEQVLIHDVERFGDDFRVHWGWKFIGMELPEGPDGSCKSTVRDRLTGDERTIFSKYVLACDGGRSQVRRWAAPYGVRLLGEALPVTWCVLDAVGLNSDFPDLERLCVIRSEKGIVLIIPREPINGKPCCRFDIQLEMSRYEVNEENITMMVKDIFKPFKIEWDEVNWWSSYDVGQRLINEYSVTDSVFFIGDACHTHSPRAGLGLNTAVLEAHNLCWKLSLVLKGVARPEILATYASERHGVAEDLVNMDRQLVKLYAGLEKQTTENFSSQEACDWLNRLFQFQATNFAYQAGASITYNRSLLVRTSSNDVEMTPVDKPGVIAGSRTKPAIVTRISDSVPVNVQPRFDGRFTIFLLVGDLTNQETARKLLELDAYIRKSGSIFAQYGSNVSLQAKPIAKRMPPLSDQSSSQIPPGRVVYTYDYEDIPPITADFTVLPHSLFRTSVITSTSTKDLVLLDNVVSCAYPRVGSTQPSHLLHPAHVFCDDIAVLSPYSETAPDAGLILKHPMHDKWGVDEQRGATIVARPDGHIGLREDGFGIDEWKAIEQYFEGFLLP
ncbi:FAD binding domain-containing protein [Vararia minispora EC-137]|uniref:FAD binding domain-containing protein n=1 Tax=Vararia minispora EC-137 TaxID=1314806 RepID=A0ACB8QYI5_9AGAM|nr:FAD binding domain-containing protein [Vararia minispora EC-137]